MSSPPQTTAHHWNRILRFFRFHFAHGGHANDMDTLSGTAHFRAGEAGLSELFGRLDLTLSPILPGTPIERPGRSHDAAAWKEVAHPIRDYPRFHAPEFVNLLGVPAHLYVRRDAVAILVSGAGGDPWQVDERDFRNAARLEELLPARGVALALRAVITDTEALYLELRERGLRSWVSGGSAQDEKIRALRTELDPRWRDDAQWEDARRELQAVTAGAAAVGAKSSFLAHRFPGYSTEFLECVCADVRSGSR